MSVLHPQGGSSAHTAVLPQSCCVIYHKELYSLASKKEARIIPRYNHQTLVTKESFRALPWESLDDGFTVLCPRDNLNVYQLCFTPDSNHTQQLWIPLKLDSNGLDFTVKLITRTMRRYVWGYRRKVLQKIKPMTLAFAMETHPRLGAASPARVIGGDPLPILMDALFRTF